MRVCIRGKTNTSIGALKLFEKANNELVTVILVKGYFMVRVNVDGVNGWWFDQWSVIDSIVGVLSVIKDF